MNGQPRIAVVHGGEDHPPNVGSKETIRRVIRQLWANGAIPFEVSQSVPCEELSYGTEGMNYALLSRNFCTASLPRHIEGARLRWRGRHWCLRQDDGRKPAGADRSGSRAPAPQGPADFRDAHSIPDRTRSFRYRRRPPEVRTAASSFERKRTDGAGRSFPQADEAACLCAGEGAARPMFPSPGRSGK